MSTKVVADPPHTSSPLVRIAWIGNSNVAIGDVVKALARELPSHVRPRFVGSVIDKPTFDNTHPNAVPLRHNGIGWLTTPQLEEHVGRWLPWLTNRGEHPDIVLVQAGVNDIVNEGVSPTEAARRLKSLVGTLRTHLGTHSRIVVIAPPTLPAPPAPAGRVFHRGMYSQSVLVPQSSRRTALAISPISIPRLTAEYALELQSLTAQLNDQRIIFVPTGEGFAFGADGIHLSPDGADRLAIRIVETVAGSPQGWLPSPGAAQQLATISCAPFSRQTITRPQPQSRTPVIMAFGDSITEQPVAYPLTLQTLLRSSGFDVDMCGSMPLPSLQQTRKSGNIGTQSKEGHSGWRVAPDMQSMVRTWFQMHAERNGSTPDVITIHAGTNDLLLDRASGNEVAERIKALVKQIHHLAPTAKLVVATPIPFSTTVTPLFEQPAPEVDAAYRDLCRVMPGVISHLRQVGINVRHVDLSNVFGDPDNARFLDFVPDAVHPNERGAKAIAELFLPAVENALKESGFTPTPTVALS